MFLCICQQCNLKYFLAQDVFISCNFQTLRMFLRAFAGPSLLCVGRAVLSNSVSYSFQSPHLRSPLDHFPILHVILHKVLGSYHGSLTWLTSCPLGGHFVCSPYHTRHMTHTARFPHVFGLFHLVILILQQLLQGCSTSAQRHLALSSASVSPSTP